MVSSISKKGAGKEFKSKANSVNITKSSKIKKERVCKTKPAVKAVPKIDRSKKLGTFIYMGLYGRGEAVRMLLYHAKILYDMIIVTSEQIPMMWEKSQLPAGQVPVWVTPDKRVLN